LACLFLSKDSPAPYFYEGLHQARRVFLPCKCKILYHFKEFRENEIYEADEGLEKYGIPASLSRSILPHRGMLEIRTP